MTYTDRPSARAGQSGLVASERRIPPYSWAALTSAVVFAIYVATLAPTTAFWDTSEYIAAAKVLGIPHPPGNPLFTLMAHVFGLLPIAATYAVRINLFAAVTSACAAGLWFLVAERWLWNIVPVRWTRYGGAFAGALVGATSWTVWNQSTVNEKVYTVSLFSIALVMWLVVRWADDPPTARRDRWIVLIAYLLALSSTNHMMGVLVIPPVLVYVLSTDWQVVTRPRALAAIVAVVLIGLSINYVYLPLRAAQYPPINEGEPVGFFSKALMDVLNREQYGKPPVTERQADLIAQLANYRQYWSWQFARDWTGLRPVITGVFTLLGLSGLYALWRAERRAGLAAAALFGTLTIALILYLNFKYGFSLYPGVPGLAREVRERDYFFVASFSAYGALVALGLGALMRWLVGFFRDRGSIGHRWALASPVLLLGLVPFFGNRVTATRAHETVARDFAVDLLRSVEPYGILITAGDNDTFPLWYAQEVEGVRRDVTLANLSLMNTRWHLRQLRRRKVEAFDADSSLWSAAGRPKPTGSVFSLGEAELDSLPEVMRAPEAGGIRVGDVAIRFGGETLELKDLAVVFLIRDNLGKRPIYFSWSDGGYPDQTLGLTPYLVSQGFVRELQTHPVTPGDSIVQSSTLGYIDLPTSRRLLWDVYHWRSAARDRPRGWVDAPSSSILQLYTVIYNGVGGALLAKGDTAAAMRADSIAAQVAENIRPRGEIASGEP